MRIEDAEARAFAPASIGNVAVGFDVLGLAIAGVGDTVYARRCESQGVRIHEIRGTSFAADAHKLPIETHLNTAGIAAQELLADYEPSFGVELIVEKGIPLGSGMGSSAASAVAAVVACNALLPAPLPIEKLLPYAMAGEAFASKAQHADNVAPSLLGRLQFCPPEFLPKSQSLQLPDDVVSVLVHPGQRVDTAAARSVLSETVSLKAAVRQGALLSSFILACQANDIKALGACFKDILIEPQRKLAVEGFDSIQSAAIAAGALGCSLSGSGPSIFALSRHSDAASIRLAMVAASEAAGFAANSWISRGNAAGAEVVLL